MKKVTLSLLVIGAITIAGGAITYAEDNTVSNLQGNITISEDVNNLEENSCIGLNTDCPYYEEGNMGIKNGEGKRNRVNSQNENKTECNGSGKVRRGYSNKL